MNCLGLIIEYFGITVSQIDYETKKLDKYHHFCTAQINLMLLFEFKTKTDYHVVYKFVLMISFPL